MSLQRKNKMHMIDVMSKLKEIAEAGYDNEDIQRGIDAAGKHVFAKEETMEGAIKGNDDDDKDDMSPAVMTKGKDGKMYPNPLAAKKAGQMKALEGTVSEKVSNFYPNDPGQDDEGDDEGTNPRLNPDNPIQKDADIERLKKTAGITSGGFKPIYNVDGSLADIAKDSGYTSIGGVKDTSGYKSIGDTSGYTSIGGAKPAPNDPKDRYYPNDPGQDDEGDPEGANPGLKDRYFPNDPGQDDEGDDEGTNPGLKDRYIFPNDPGQRDRISALTRQGKYDTSKIKEDDDKEVEHTHEDGTKHAHENGDAEHTHDDDIQEVHEDEIDEAVVEVPVNELAELMQLAGYTDYAEKIEEYANEPDPEYMDAEEQLVGLSGGLNGPKKAYAAAAGGDNAMAQEPQQVRESSFDSFYAKYDKFVKELSQED